MLKPCLARLGDGHLCGALSDEARCPAHRTYRTTTRGQTTTQRGYGTAWQREAKAKIEAHRAAHGDWCPGWPPGVHARRCNPRDLVVDHDVGVLSRQCNSRKAATYDKQRNAMKDGGGD